jgi:hypothetical protein
VPQILKMLGWGEFLMNRVTAPVGLPACKFYPMNPVCTMLLNAMFYGPSQFMPTDDFWLVATTWPASVTSRNLEHWSQVKGRGRGGVYRAKERGGGHSCVHVCAC